MNSRVLAYLSKKTSLLPDKLNEQDWTKPTAIVHLLLYTCYVTS
jgi:hypothetical protein